MRSLSWAARRPAASRERSSGQGRAPEALEASWPTLVQTSGTSAFSVRRPGHIRARYRRSKYRGLFGAELFNNPGASSRSAATWRWWEVGHRDRGRLLPRIVTVLTDAGTVNQPAARSKGRGTGHRPGPGQGVHRGGRVRRGRQPADRRRSPTPLIAPATEVPRYEMVEIGDHHVLTTSVGAKGS